LSTVLTVVSGLSSQLILLLSNLKLHLKLSCNNTYGRFELHTLQQEILLS